jgi:lipid-A-disaccharide synthase
MAATARLVQKNHPAQWLAVFTCERLRQRALDIDAAPGLPLDTRIGGLEEELARATLAIAATGTVTLECALWRVPTIAIYKASWSTYQIARRIIRVRHLAMPNLLANASVMPELLQNDASPENVAATASRLLAQPEERATMQRALASVIGLLGHPGAANRAAESVLSLLPSAP